MRGGEWGRGQEYVCYDKRKVGAARGRVLAQFMGAGNGRGGGWERKRSRKRGAIEGPDGKRGYGRSTT